MHRLIRQKRTRKRQKQFSTLHQKKNGIIQGRSDDVEKTESVVAVKDQVEKLKVHNSANKSSRIKSAKDENDQKVKNILYVGIVQQVIVVIPTNLN